MTRRGLLAAAGATVAVTAGAVLTTRHIAGPSAETPPLLTFSPTTSTGSETAQLLRDLAERARQQRLPGAGEVLYSRRRDWSFATSIGTNGEDLGSGLSEWVVETWLPGQGTGRSLRQERNPGPGATPLTLEGTPSPEEQRVPSSEPMDHDALVTWFRDAGREWSTSRWFEAARTSWSAPLHDPAITSAFLEALAAQDGMRTDGYTTDRAGRRAIAISTTGHRPTSRFPQQRFYLLCAPDTGKLLAAETQGLTTNPESLNTPVSTPATIAYRIWAEAALVTNTTSRP